MAYISSRGRDGPRLMIVMFFLGGKTMTENEIDAAKLILKDYKGFNGENMIDIETNGLQKYKNYLKNIKGLKDEAVENTVKLLLDYLSLKGT
jgi:hypothetical protein